MLEQSDENVLSPVAALGLPGSTLFVGRVELFCRGRKQTGRLVGKKLFPSREEKMAGKAAGYRSHTSQVSVEVVHPLDLGLQLVPHCLLQALALGRALHQSLIGFRDPLDLQLQLGRERKCAWSVSGGEGGVDGWRFCFAC